jgi:hypothetical protein
MAGELDQPDSKRRSSSTASLLPMMRHLRSIA